MHKTPLHQFHLDHKAHMVDFVGWDMPLYYTAMGITQEHHQVRKSGGIFDVSHMGRVRFKGRHSRKLLERLCSRRIHDMVAGQCRYSLVCNEQGGVKDDVIVYRLDDDEFLMVVNASNREKLLPHFDEARRAGDFACDIKDETMQTSMVALQGPAVMPLIGKFSKEVPTLKKYRFVTKNLMIIKLIVSRTGYTGEDGVEVILPAGTTNMAMKLLLNDVDMTKPDAALKPAGLGCRDTLRTEAGMPLYGHELGEEINALSCGVDFAIAVDKADDDKAGAFIGSDALKKTVAAGGPPRKLAGLVVPGKRAARQGAKVLKDGKEVGVVTSGCPSPTLGETLGGTIAMCFLDKDLHQIGTDLELDTGKGVLAAKVAPLPFYKAPKVG
ncbi:MAG TPA: glycine cleavage system aminomethyltransferase GcvT [Phycisphaerales bacterium]|nr:glycine cleavage system aminomethyltransferase GcvT [Phycisphaerales bacterium]